jgi:hypothetical protein
MAFLSLGLMLDEKPLRADGRRQIVAAALRLEGLDHLFMV